MREIKFRAWDNENRKMREVTSLHVRNNPPTAHVTMQGTDALMKDIVLMQFTGLHDKNGKEIYEGDIINSLYRRDGCEGLYEVQWSASRASFFSKWHKNHQQKNVAITPSDWQRCEVIGNIYENSDLLV